MFVLGQDKTALVDGTVIFRPSIAKACCVNEVKQQVNTAPTTNLNNLFFIVLISNPIVDWHLFAVLTL